MGHDLVLNLGPLLCYNMSLDIIFYNTLLLWKKKEKKKKKKILKRKFHLSCITIQLAEAHSNKKRLVIFS